MLEVGSFRVTDEMCPSQKIEYLETGRILHVVTETLVVALDRLQATNLVFIRIFIAYFDFSITRYEFLYYFILLTIFFTNKKNRKQLIFIGAD